MQPLLLEGWTKVCSAFNGLCVSYRCEIQNPLISTFDATSFYETVRFSDVKDSKRAALSVYGALAGSDTIQYATEIEKYVTDMKLKPLAYHIGA